MGSPHTWASLLRPTATFTRPADTNAYASGDLIANSTVAASVAAMQFSIGNNMAGQSFLLRRLKLIKSTNVLTSAQFRMHFFTADPFASAPAAGDNGALVFAAGVIGDHVGQIDVTIDKNVFNASDGSLGYGVQTEGSKIGFYLPASASGLTLFGVLEARAAYGPGSGEVFTATLELYKDR